MYSSTSNNQPNLNDSKYLCCFGVHVEKAAYVIAFVGALLAAISALVYFLNGNIGYAMGSALNFFIYFSILWAQSKQNPGLYLPFLVLNGLAILMLIGNIAFLVILYIYMPEWYIYQIRDKWRREGKMYPISQYEFYSQLRLSLALYAIGTTVYTVICAWFWSCVYRAYDYMKVIDGFSTNINPETGTLFCVVGGVVILEFMSWINLFHIT